MPIKFSIKTVVVVGLHKYKVRNWWYQEARWWRLEINEVQILMPSWILLGYFFIDSIWRNIEYLLQYWNCGCSCLSLFILDFLYLDSFFCCFQEDVSFSSYPSLPHKFVLISVSVPIGMPQRKVASSFSVCCWGMLIVI